MSCDGLCSVALSHCAVVGLQREIVVFPEHTNICDIRCGIHDIGTLLYRI